MENLKKIQLKDPIKDEETRLKKALELAKENYSEKFVKNTKELPDSINEKYFTFVNDSEDFRERLDIIKNSEEKIAEYIEPIADNYDEKLNLSYKLKQKARFIMGLSIRKENKKWNSSDNTDKNSSKSSDKKNLNESDVNTEKEQIKSRFENDDHLEEELEEYLSLELGLSDNMFFTLQKKIKLEKETKGRGLLISFNQENEEKRVPKLIRAMKLGLRVTLVSDAGTPTISDPGYKLVKEAAKSGILIEPLPGPVAAITALSASSMPTDKFLFIGYLSKSAAEKISKLREEKNIGFTSIFYENPQRLIKTIECIKEVYGGKHEIYIGVELTKKFETHFYGKIDDIINKIEEKYNKDNAGIRGEITLILAPVDKVESTDKNFLNETLNLDLLQFAKSINDTMDFPTKTFRDLLINTCKISRVKASNIINHLRFPESKLQMEVDSFKGVKLPNLATKKEEFIDNLKERKSSKSIKKIKVVKTKLSNLREEQDNNL